MSLLLFFDPRDDVTVVERRLPHWSQPGVLAFITWRTHDSIPAAVLQTWREERQAWLRRRGINPLKTHWREELAKLPRADQVEFYRHFSSRWHQELDAGHGECLLRKAAHAKVVADSLLHFDGQRYELTDFVVMPNHVHVLAAFPNEQGMLQQCRSWKHYMAYHIQRPLGLGGRFWQQDGFDHLVRSQEQFDHFRRYIAENPSKANIPPHAALAWSKRLT